MHLKITELRICQNFLEVGGSSHAGNLPEFSAAGAGPEFPGIGVLDSPDLGIHLNWKAA